MTTPVTHVEDAQKLNADGKVDLYELTMQTSPSPTIKYFRAGPLVTWQSKTFEKIGCQMGEESKNADEQVSRPQFVVGNPGNIWGPFVDAGDIDLAVLKRYTVLRADLETDVNIAETQIWVIGRVVSSGGDRLIVELRSTSDLPNFTIPTRRFTAPEFPFVVLG